MAKAKVIPILQPPDALMPGFLDFAKRVKQQADENGKLFSPEEYFNVLNSDFSGRIRYNFFFWVIDTNKIIDGVNLILSDLNDLINDKNAFKGDPIVRTELLVISFFSEFFRIKELSKIYLKVFYKAGIINSDNKKVIVEAYYKAFDTYYEIRNQIVHQGMSFVEEDVRIDWAIFDDLAIEDKTRFIALLQESNTRSNTVEIQCAVYVKIINEIMTSFLSLQNKINDALADLVVEYEKLL